MNIKRSENAKTQCPRNFNRVDFAQKREQRVVVRKDRSSASYQRRQENQRTV